LAAGEGDVATTVKIVDEWTPGGTAHEWALDLLTERVTARDLIRSRVYQEVSEYNARTPGYFRGLVIRPGSEVTFLRLVPLVGG
jgi:hypothetical protein